MIIDSREKPAETVMVSELYSLVAAEDLAQRYDWVPVMAGLFGLSWN